MEAGGGGGDKGVGCDILDINIDDMELTFSKEEYSDDGQLVRVSGGGEGRKGGVCNILDNNIDDMELTNIQMMGS